MGSSLLTLKAEEAEILADVMRTMEEDGVIQEVDDKKLSEIETRIKDKLNAYINVIKKGGLLDYEIATAKKNIEDLKYFIETLEKRRDWMVGVVHQHLSAPTEFAIDGSPKWVRRDFNVTRDVDMSKVEDEYIHWDTKVVLAPNEKKAIEHVLQGAVFNGDIDPQLESKMLEAMKPKCGISNLPEGHEAIFEKKRTPVLKITKKKPKEENNEAQN